MKNVVYVAPFLKENTLQYVRAFAHLPDVRLGVVSHQPSAALPPDLRERVAAHFQVGDAMDPAELARATRAISGEIGGVDRLLGHLEQLQIPLAQARQALGIDGMWEEAARNFREKARMKAVLREAGVPVARHRLCASTDDLRAFAREVGLPIVVKPPAGLGAAATYRVSNDAELHAVATMMHPSAADPLQAEEFVEAAEENTFETVTIRGIPVWDSGTRYLPGPLEVLENPWMQYVVLLPRETDDPRFSTFRPINHAALRALGMTTGISHMEWFRRKDGTALVSEVGARPPGAMIMPLMTVAHDVDMVSVWAKLMVYDDFEAPTRKFAAGCAFFRGQGQGRVRAVHGLAEAQEEVGQWVVDRKLPEVGQPKGSTYEGEGWAVVRCPDTATAVHALKRLVSLVRVELGG